MDMIVNLYALKEPFGHLIPGVRIERMIPFEASEVIAFVKKNFPESQWAEEIKGALLGPSPRVFIAVYQKQIIGFAAYDVTAKGYFGPFGVQEDMRKKGVGEALAYRTFLAMKEDGYGYAVIGWAGPQKFYESAFQAMALNNTLEESVYSRSWKK